MASAQCHVETRCSLGAPPAPEHSCGLHHLPSPILAPRTPCFFSHSLVPFNISQPYRWSEFEAIASIATEGRTDMSEGFTQARSTSQSRPSSVLLDCTHATCFEPSLPSLPPLTD